MNMYMYCCTVIIDIIMVASIQHPVHHTKLELVVRLHFWSSEGSEVTFFIAITSRFINNGSIC